MQRQLDNGFVDVDTYDLLGMLSKGMTQSQIDEELRRRRDRQLAQSSMGLGQITGQLKAEPERLPLGEALKFGYEKGIQEPSRTVAKFYVENVPDYFGGNVLRYLAKGAGEHLSGVKKPKLTDLYPEHVQPLPSESSGFGSPAQISSLQPEQVPEENWESERPIETLPKPDPEAQQDALAKLAQAQQDAGAELGTDFITDPQNVAIAAVMAALPGSVVPLMIAFTAQGAGETAKAIERGDYGAAAANAMMTALVASPLIYKGLGSHSLAEKPVQSVMDRNVLDNTQHLQSIGETQGLGEAELAELLRGESQLNQTAAAPSMSPGDVQPITPKPGFVQPIADVRFENMMQQAFERIKVRAAEITNQPMLAEASILPDYSENTPIAQYDIASNQIRYNPEHFMNLPSEQFGPEIVRVLAHEGGAHGGADWHQFAKTGIHPDTGKAIGLAEINGQEAYVDPKLNARRHYSPELEERRRLGMESGTGEDILSHDPEFLKIMDQLQENLKRENIQGRMITERINREIGKEGPELPSQSKLTPEMEESIADQLNRIKAHGDTLPKDDIKWLADYEARNRRSAAPEQPQKRIFKPAKTFYEHLQHSGFEKTERGWFKDGKRLTKANMDGLRADYEITKGQYELQKAMKKGPEVPRDFEENLEPTLIEPKPEAPKAEIPTWKEFAAQPENAGKTPRKLLGEYRALQRGEVPEPDLKSANAARKAMGIKEPEPEVGPSHLPAYRRTLPSTRNVKYVNKEGGEMLDTFETKRDANVGRLKAFKRHIVEKLNKNQKSQVVELLDGKAEITAQTEPIVAKTYKRLRTMLELLNQEQADLGVSIGHRENYFPHYHEKTGQFMPPEFPKHPGKAPRRAGHLEMHRKSQEGSSGYSKDLDYALDKYFEEHGRRSAEAEVLGKTHEKFNKAFKGQKLDEFTKQYIKTTVDRVTGNSPTTWGDKVGGVLRTWASRAQLGAAAPLQLLAGTNTAMSGGLIRSVKALAKMATKSGRNREFLHALRSGALSQNIRTVIAKEGSGYLHGVPTMDRAMRVHANSVGMYLYKDAIRGNKSAIQMVKDLGFDTNKMKTFNAFDVGHALSDKAQFKMGPGQNPLALSSPMGKMLWQYRNTAYQQMMFTSDVFRKAKLGFVRPLAVMLSSGMLLGEVANNTRSLMRDAAYGIVNLLPGGKEDIEKPVWDEKDWANFLKNPLIPWDHPIKRAMQNLALLSGLGIMQDFAYTEGPNDITNTLAGPVTTTAIEGGWSPVEAAKKRSLAPIGRFAIRQIPLFGQPLAKKYFPPKRRKKSWRR